MRLSADKIAEKLERLPFRLLRKPDDPRRAPRLFVDGSVAITTPALSSACPDPRGIPCKVMDVSSRGIRLLHGEALPACTQFVLHLSRHRRRPVDILCCVRHCKPDDNGMYMIGAEFICRLGAEQKGAGVLERVRDSILGQ